MMPEDWWTEEGEEHEHEDQQQCVAHQRYDRIAAFL